ncbi:MAG TPA: class I SAM-dependent methyltransferase [Candidatus Binatia bacterium]|nr:class I SAM-dependent methyltransferase [Candidatus Binatia bacterium]
MGSELVSRYFERFHQAFGKEGTLMIPERFEFFREEVGSGKDVIELGCRYGDLLSHFSNGNRVMGIDVDRHAVAVCRKRFGIPTEVANLNETLPLADQSFDVVVLSEVLEHLPYPELTLGEITRILRPNGRLIGSVPNATKAQNRIRFLLTGRVEIDPTHLHFFSERTLVTLLSQFFERWKLRYVGGRYRIISPRWLASYILFSAGPPRHS